MKRPILLLAALICCVLGFAKEPQRPESYNYQRGCELISDMNLDEGMEFLDAELRQNPKNGYAFAWLASANVSKGEYGTAIYQINQAIKFIPKKDKYYHAWAHTLLAGIYMEMQDTAAAIAEFDKAVKFDPKNERWYEGRGLLYRELKQWSKSDAEFEKYISLTPGLIRGHMLLGRNYFLQERYAEALERYSYAHKLAPRAWTLSTMAECEVKLGKYEEAADHVIESLKQETFEETAVDVLATCKNEVFVDLVKAKLRVQIAKNPNAPDWLFYSALVDRGQKNYEEAIRTCQKIRQVYPDATFDDIVAGLYSDMGDWAHALQYENEAIAADTADIDYRYSRCTIYFEMDSIEAMYADINHLIEDNPEDASLRFARGSMHLYQRNYEQAIEDYNTGLAIDSSNDWARYTRGRCYDAAGDTEKAKKDILRVENSNQRVDIGMFAKAFLGKKDEAMALADSLLKVDTVDHQYRYNVACVYALVGEKELALRYIEEELEDGYVQFAHLRLDPDLQSIQGEEFELLIQKYEAIRDERIARFREEQGEEAGEERVVEVPFTAANGVTKVDCTINGLPLNFVFDTGASDVTISQTEANFMYKNGYLSRKDVVGKQAYQLADGHIAVGTILILNHINFGGLELTDVRASVVANQNAPLLLGQTILQRLGKIEIDNERKVLKITTKK